MYYWRCFTIGDFWRALIRKPFPVFFQPNLQGLEMCSDIILWFQLGKCFRSINKYVLNNFLFHFTSVSTLQLCRLLDIDFISIAAPSRSGYGQFEFNLCSLLTPLNISCHHCSFRTNCSLLMCPICHSLCLPKQMPFQLMNEDTVPCGLCKVIH